MIDCFTLPLPNVGLTRRGARPGVYHNSFGRSGHRVRGEASGWNSELVVCLTFFQFLDISLPKYSNLGDSIRREDSQFMESPAGLPIPRLNLTISVASRQFIKLFAHVFQTLWLKRVVRRVSLCKKKACLRAVPRATPSPEPIRMYGVHTPPTHRTRHDESIRWSGCA